MKLLTLLSALLLLAAPASAVPDIVVEGRDATLGTWPNIDDNDLNPDQAVTDFDRVTLGSTKVRTFRVRNTGNQTLTITSIVSDDSRFTISGLPAGTNVAAGGENEFTITYEPLSRGTHQAVITIRSNDPDAEDPYTFAIEGIGEGPEAKVEGSTAANGTYFSITDGDTTPGISSGTNFETIAAGSTRTRYFRITNDGDTGLNINNPRITGTDASSFSVQSLSGLTNIAPGNSRDFEIRFEPDLAGTKTATFTVETNDADENPYNFTVTGVATGDPEIEVQGFDGLSWQNIADADLTPDQQVTDFDNVDTGTTSDRSYRVRNTGTDVLNITSATSSSTAFTIIGLGTSVAPGAEDTFTIRFAPVALGTVQSVITLVNNDPTGSESTYTFAVEGTGTGPEISIAGGTVDGGTVTSIVSGDTTPLAADGTDFLSVEVGNQRTHYFRITNSGNAALNISDPEIGGAHPSQFRIESLSGLTNIAAGGTRDFRIVFEPTSAGIKNATFTLTTNDGNENPYTFTLAGQAIALPDIAVQGSDGIQWIDIADGDGTPDQQVTDFDNVDAGTTRDRTYRIRNTGSAALSISSVTVAGTRFAVIGAPTSVAAGADAQFTIRFLPVAHGDVTSGVTIVSNDPDGEGSYTFAITGTGTAPDLHVAGSTDAAGPYTAISSGDVTPSQEEGTDFATVETGNFRTRYFRITNNGNTGLNIQTPTFTGAGAAHFEVRSLSSATNIGAGNTRDFEIRYQPTVAGTHTATFRMVSNDPGTATFTMFLTGTAIVVPDLKIEGEDLVFGTWVDIDDGDHVPDQNVVDLGRVDLGSTRTRDFRITNTGTAPLEFLGRSSSGAAFTFSDFGPVLTSLAPGAQAFIHVTFTPAVRAEVTSIITLNTNAQGNHAAYSFAVKGVGEGPEIHIQGQGNDSTFRNIPDGTTTTSTGTGTDFGSTNVTGSTAQRVFRLHNNGDKALNITGRSFSGPAAADYDVSGLLIAGVRIINPGNSIDFTVSFDPRTSGTRNAVLSIVSDDADENPYDFSLTGVGIGTPEITLKGNRPAEPRVEISDGSTTPAQAGGTLFADTDAGEIRTHNFRILNDGDGRLTFTTPTLTGANPGAFQIIGFTAAALDPGDTKDFQIRFAPTLFGTKSAVFSLGCNDANENPFDFVLQGTCTAPEISVQGGASFVEELTDGDTSPREADGTDFGSVGVSNQSVTRTFRIRNIGTKSLTGISAGVSGTQFTVTTAPAATLAAGAQTTFVITFNPSVTGAVSATAQVDSNDPNEGQFTFALAGFGTDSNPSIRVTGENDTAFTAGQTTTSAAAGTDFGEVNITAGTATRTFSVENTGTGPLSISGITSNSTRFVVGTLTLNPLSPGQSMDFSVTFDPAGSGAVFANITIASNVAVTPSFTFRVTGTGVDTTPPTAPEISLSGGDALDVTISSGDTTPRLRDGTDFQTAEAGTAVERTFRLSNPGTAPLLISSASASGAGNVRGLAASIPAGGFDDFVVSINRRTAGIANVTVTIASNDASEPSYTFAVRLEAIVTGSLSLTDFRIDGTDVILSFTSIPGRTYRITSSTDPAATWMPETGFTGIEGDSIPQTVVLPDAADPGIHRRFFRVEEAPPQ